MTYRAPDMQEILSLIFEAADQAVLARAAQCCKAFSNPALDVLWRDLPTPEPLRKLLPVRFDRHGGLPNDVFVRDDQCVRFTEYARRVQYIRTTSNLYLLRLSRGSPWNFSFIFQIAHLLPGHMSFPKLRNLTLEEHGRCDVSLNIIIPPTLRDLTLIRLNPMAPGRSPLQVAVCQAPLLQSLTIAGEMPWIYVPYIARFKYLTAIFLQDMRLDGNPEDVNRVYHDLIRDLSHRRLAILVLPLDLTYDAIPRDVTSLHLKELRTSNIPSIIRAFLDVLAPGKLATFRCRDPSLVARNEWRTCFDSVRQRCGSSLRTLNVKIQTADDGLSAMETIQPLLEIHGLEHVTLLMFPTASSDEVKAMASAWPYLTSFRLGNEWGHEGRTSCPLQGLVDLCYSCPRLITLVMRISDDLSDMDLDSLPALSHGLQSLTLHVPDDTNHVLLARVLDKLFPSLQTLTVHPGEQQLRQAPPAVSAFEDVLQMLKAFQAIRDECRSGILR
ncbi:hypothetical protein PILCRDRAFT_5294 [Piloderma croceum F 1598]|uniref:F-box domain-containing protein n=1 Tax=Piloderma croceum (strain F 1598) TaxID=765440 RepID=A0A0C3C7I8_PILCF|nr:hypothetical protein PILCRDRAFT_5294 [Piloderma croceum F 1598]